MRHPFLQRPPQKQQATDVQKWLSTQTPAAVSNPTPNTPQALPAAPTAVTYPQSGVSAAVDSLPAFENITKSPA